MAATKYAQHVGSNARREKHMPRAERYGRANETAARGTALPQSKLDDEKVAAIRSAARQRENLKKHIREKLSNEALAKQYNVHVRTIEKVLSRETGSHVA